MSDDAPVSFVATYGVAAPFIGAGLALWIGVRHYGDWFGTVFSIIAGCCCVVGVVGSIRLWKRVRQR
jgi:hypothetical protein